MVSCDSRETKGHERTDDNQGVQDIPDIAAVRSLVKHHAQIDDLESAMSHGHSVDRERTLRSNSTVNTPVKA